MTFGISSHSAVTDLSDDVVAFDITANENWNFPGGVTIRGIPIINSTNECTTPTPTNTWCRRAGTFTGCAPYWGWKENGESIPVLGGTGLAIFIHRPAPDNPPAILTQRLPGLWFQSMIAIYGADDAEEFWRLFRFLAPPHSTWLPMSIDAPNVSGANLTFDASFAAIAIESYLKSLQDGLFGFEIVDGMDSDGTRKIGDDLGWVA